MAHNSDAGWTLTPFSGDTITIRKSIKDMDGRPTGVIDVKGPMGGIKLPPTKVSSTNMAELIAALVIASDDKTLRKAAKMVQRVPGQPRPFLTRSEVWAIVNGYDVDHPQEQFGDPSAGDQCAAFMSAMQPEPGMPPSWEQLRKQLASKIMNETRVGGEVNIEDCEGYYVRLAGDDQWVFIDGEDRTLTPAREVLNEIEDTLTDQQVNNYAKEINQ